MSDKSAPAPTEGNIRPEMMGFSLGITFNEKFFDRVFVKRLGWEKVPRSKVQGQQTVDYAGDGYALELKNLETNSLGDPSERARKRRHALVKFQMEEEKAGNLIADHVNGVAAAARGKRKEISDRLWRSHVGNSVRNAVVEANLQIGATRTLRPEAHLRGAVLIVNEALKLIDAISLAGLLSSYLMEPNHQNPSERHVKNVDVAYGLCSTLERLKPEHGGEIVHPLVCAGTGAGPTPQDIDLQDKLCKAIAAEVQSVTARPSIHVTPPDGALEAPQRIQPIPLGGPTPMNIRVAGTEHPDAELDPGFSGVIARVWRRAKAGEINRQFQGYRFLSRWETASGIVNVEQVDTRLVIPENTVRVAERFDRQLPKPIDARDQESLARFLQIVESATARVPNGPLFFHMPEEATPVFLKSARQILSLFAAVHLLRGPQVLQAFRERANAAWPSDWPRENGLPHAGELWFRLLGGGAVGFSVDGFNLGIIAETLFDRPWHVTHVAGNMQRFATGNVPVELDGSLEAGARAGVYLPLGIHRFVSINGQNAVGKLLPEAPVVVSPNQKIEPWSPLGLTERVGVAM